MMGSHCLTDGAWVWPEGLTHYVECHDVRLPGEFVEGMRERNWRIPEGTALPCFRSQGEPDYDVWIEWGRVNTAANGRHDALREKKGPHSGVYKMDGSGPG